MREILSEGSARARKRAEKPWQRCDEAMHLIVPERWRTRDR